MAGKYDDVRVRRVVAGLDKNGRSTIVSDGFTETRLVTDAFILNQSPSTTLAPFSANPVAAARPIPMLAPVTSATCPLKS